jgi:hypothetical protein
MRPIIIRDIDQLIPERAIAQRVFDRAALYQHLVPGKLYQLVSAGCFTNVHVGIEGNPVLVYLGLEGLNCTIMFLKPDGNVCKAGIQYVNMFVEFATP